MTPIAIPEEVLAAICAHAIAAFPDECCGYLVGTAPGTVDAAVACHNAQAGGDPPLAPELGARRAETSFAIEGRELFQFARSFGSERPARIVYHSHTNGLAYFSTIDRRMAAGPAYPVQHVVIGVATPAGSPRPALDPLPSVTEIAQFAWSDVERDYVEVARFTRDGVRR
ncbi:MAG TPA: Mov34/MPN/PAD-1 family protein [Kofleriaceae bacterium]|nr:Mov34/MPN/PAD-1 family protein [Kofleriaceae bacterium]